MLSRLHDRLGLRTGPVIFFTSAFIVTLFTLAMGFFPGPVQSVFGALADVMRYDIGWVFTLGATAMLVFAVGMAFSRFGRLKLGPDDGEPVYSGIAWFGMIFAAGVGAILMFFGVAEPITHYAVPPLVGVEPYSEQAALDATSIGTFHFGFQLWAIQVVPGLAFAYFTYKRNLPPRASSAFQPFIGDRIHGPWGKTIDIMAIVATVFGIAVSIGLGAMQINAGLTYVYGVPMQGWIQALTIALITGAGLTSVLLGMDKGVKRLSYLNILMAVALMLFVLMWGATMDTFRGVVETAGRYLYNLPVLSFFNDFSGSGQWTGDWTVFYWAWAVTWSPFVGMFIAKISRGRTIREFVIATIGMPTSFVIVWMSVWGISGIMQDQATATSGAGGELVETVVDDGNIEAALFQFLQGYPAFGFVAVFALIVIVIFFVTSMDSGALVMDGIASGHEDAGPKRQRGFWTVSIGAVCTVILVTAGENGFNAMQEVIIVIGLPLMILTFIMMLSLLQAVREDYGSARPIRTRQWKRVLPMEEFHRRAQEEPSATEEFVIRPEYEVGTEPDFDTHQPQTWHWQRGDGNVEDSDADQKGQQS